MLSLPSWLRVLLRGGDWLGEDNLGNLMEVREVRLLFMIIKAITVSEDHLAVHHLRLSPMEVTIISACMKSKF